MFTMLKQGNTYIDDKYGVYTEFVCSSASDIANLPTGAESAVLDRPRPGSIAVVPSADGRGMSTYVLSNGHTWVLSTGSGGGGGTGGGDYVLPTATATRLGGVRIGDGVNVDAVGSISVDAQSVLAGAVASGSDTEEMLNEVFNEPENENSNE